MKEIDLNSVVKFIVDRKKEDGGFAQTPFLPHTVEDTFHAISILQQIQRDTNSNILKKLINTDNTINYLMHSLNQQWLDIKTIFQLTYLSKVVGIDLGILKTKVKEYFTKSIKNNICSYYYGIMLFQDIINEEFTFPFKNTLIIQNDRYTSKEVLMLITVRKYYNLPVDIGYLSTWLKKCQTCDGGFGFYPGTTSYIENCHFCLKALSLLGSKPIDTAGVYNFILACQTESGGFARKNNGAPFLDATWHAIAGLSILNSMHFQQDEKRRTRKMRRMP